MTTSFEELLNNTKMLKKGDKVTGIVSRIDADMAYVDVAGAQYDCVILKNQASRKFVSDIRDVLSVGDEVEAVVTGVRADREKRSEDIPGIIYLSRKIIENQEFNKLVDMSWNDIVTKFENGEYVTATVTGTTKAGLLVDINGIRAFVPASYIDTKFVKNLAKFVGKEYTFKIEEVDKSKNKLILNRRFVLEEEEAKKLDEIFTNLNVGDVLEGTVNRITDFGAFVNIGEIDGLVHISEISNKRFDKITDVLTKGEVVKVAVIGLDREAGRVSLSIKTLLPTQWDVLKASVNVGDVLEGTVKNITSFGAFVEVIDFVEGLVHISQIAHEKVTNVNEFLKQGDVVNVKVLEIDSDNNRLALSIKELLEKPVVEIEEKEAEYDTSYLKSEDTQFSLADKFKDLQ